MKKKLIWNKANTVILAIMIVIVAGIGQQKNTKHVQIPEEMTESAEDTGNVQKSVVHVDAEDYMGSGLVLDITQDEVIVATCRHLIDTARKVSLKIQEQQIEGRIMWRSQQYDIAFLSFDRELFQTEPVAVTLPDSEKKWQESTWLGTDVWQYSNAEKEEVHTGYITDEAYIAEFDCKLLVTDCFSRAGMSGGGVFDENGMLLGMILGGETAKESEKTYSISSWIMQKEYEMAQNSMDK